MKKRVLSVILAIMMIATLVPASIFSAFAAEPEYELIIDEDGVLTGYTGTLPADLVIPDGVTEIGASLFEGCTSLESVMIPDSVISIGGSAFNGCTSLATISVGSNISDIGARIPFVNTAFYLDDSNWENGALYLTARGGVTHYLLKVNEDVSGDFQIKEGTKIISGRAFSQRTSLESVTIPDSVTTIGDQAFSECTNLANVTVLESAINSDSVTSIGHNAFYGCTSLESVKFGNKATIIGEMAFYGCTSLESVIFVNCIYIGSYAFEGCTSLQSLTIPMLDCVMDIEWGSTRSIATSAFEGCTSLESVTILNGATTPDEISLLVLDRAFYGCTSLVKVEIILNNHEYDGSSIFFSNNAFGNCNENLTIYSDAYGYPYFHLKEYAADNGINFENIRMFTVTFVDGEETLSEQKVKYGGTVTAPDAPPKDDYVFAGWVDEDGNLVDLETLKVTEDMTLTAKYEINTYNVTFVMFDGEEEQTLGSLPIKHGEGLGEFAAQLEEIVAEEAGEAFYLAYLIENEQGEVEEIDIYDFVIKEDITIYMAVLPRLYYVKFVDEDGTAIGNEEGEIVLHGEKVTAPEAPPKDDYVFAGWVDEDGNLVDLAEKEITEDMTLTAKYEINSFTVTFFAGALPEERYMDKFESVSVKTGVSYGSDPSKLIATESFDDYKEFKNEKFGMSFLRFFFCLFRKPTGKWIDIRTGNVVTTITSDITLYAEYDWFWNV